MADSGSSPSAQGGGACDTRPLQSDAWTAGTAQRMRQKIAAEAARLGVDITNPRYILSEPELMEVLSPGSASFCHSQQWWRSSIQGWVSKITVNVETFGVTEALDFCRMEENGVGTLTNEHFNSLIQHVAKRVGLQWLGAHLTCGTNQLGWKNLVQQLEYRTLSIWEDPLLGIEKSGESTEQQVATFAGQQDAALAEHVLGDIHCALERFTFMLSDTRISHEAKQLDRKGDRDSSAKFLAHILGQLVLCSFSRPDLALGGARGCGGHSEVSEGAFHQAAAVFAAEGVRFASVTGEEPGCAAFEPRRKMVRRGDTGGASQPGSLRAKTSPPPLVSSLLSFTVDRRTAAFLEFISNIIREVVPLELAEHPVFSSVMKIDETLYREVSARAARREAFMKALYGGSWEMSTQTHL